jgi:sugar phosphate isomerase/epimerase
VPFDNLNYTFDESIGAISRIGYESLEIAFLTLERGVYLHPDSINSKEKKRIRDVCNLHRVEIAALGAYANHLFKDEVKRHQSVEFVKKTLALAADIGVSKVVTVSGEAEMDSKKAWQILVDLTKEEAVYAEDVGVKIALHPHVKNLILSTDDTIRLISEVNSDYLRITFDGAHLYVSNFDLIKATRKLGKYTVHAHLMGIKGKQMGDSSSVGIEDSDFPNIKWLETLKKEGFDGAVAIRVPDAEKKSILENRARREYNYLNKILRRL